MRNSLTVIVFLYLAGAMLATSIEGQERWQGRSMVISKHGIVEAESPLGAQAGVRMLERGGNAVDAAIAANGVMGVVAPMSNGIGGEDRKSVV
jgi:gamma-glutamyltranspeptidase/glutathione hydrolase